MRTVIRNALLGAVLAAVPVSTTVAAVRPNAAVPTASSTAVAAQAPVYDDRRAGGFRDAWPIFLFGGAMVILVLLELLDDEEVDPPVAISPG